MNAGGKWNAGGVRMNRTWPYSHKSGHDMRCKALLLL